MDIKIVIDFFKEMELYNEEFFNEINKNTTIYDKPYEEIKDFIGCYPIYNNKDKLVNFKLILPKINSIYDILIYIHEYTHALFIDDDSQIFPNIMEGIFINKYILDNKLHNDIIWHTLNEIKNSNSDDHIIGKRIKLFYISKNLDK